MAIQPLADELAYDPLDKLGDGSAQLVPDEPRASLRRRGHTSESMTDKRRQREACLEPLCLVRLADHDDGECSTG